MTTTFISCLATYGAESLYGHFYDKFFSQYVATPPRSILVVGCGNGRFCCALADFFPDAHVYAIDIAIDQVDVCALAPANVTFLGMDATLSGFVRMLPGGAGAKYDLIIDDVRADHNTICELAIDYMAEQGAYIVEYADVKMSAVQEFVARRRLHVDTYEWLPVHEHTLCVISPL
jgi:methylase of polypeptide subunit release factors